jgi:Ca2+-binding EF-hand superfamily protein
MNKKFQFGSGIRRFGACAFFSCLLANVAVLRAQVATFAVGAEAAGGATNFVFQTGAGGGGVGAFFINGSDIGTVLLKACDLDQDAKVTLVELKAVAAASFKLWDNNSDGVVSSNELSAALKEFFPAPPQGGGRAMRVINGVATEVSPSEMVTPDVVLVRHLLVGADSNKDALLSLQEVNDFIEKNFGQWDADTSGALNAQELGGAFGSLSFPDEIMTAPIR